MKTKHQIKVIYQIAKIFIEESGYGGIYKAIRSRKFYKTLGSDKITAEFLRSKKSQPE